MSKLNLEALIAIYETGKYSDLQLADIFKTSERTIQRRLAELRVKGKTKERKHLLISKTASIPSGDTQERTTIDWKIPKASKKKAKEKPFKSYLVIGDPHVPYVNTPAIKSILSLMDDVTFDGFILLGDFMDMTPISHWLQKKSKRKSLENKRMKVDYVEGNKLLDEFDKRLSEKCDKRFFYGNHERFYYDMIEEYPALEGMFEPKEELHLKDRGYIIYDKINHIEKIGRLCFTHGMYHTQNYVKAHVDKFMTNVIHADVHSPRLRIFPSPAREIAIIGYCIGCLSDLNPAYLRGKPNRWAHGFAIVYFYENGFFDVDLKRIVQGRYIFNNKLYDGNK